MTKAKAESLLRVADYLESEIQQPFFAFLSEEPFLYNQCAPKSTSNKCYSRLLDGLDDESLCGLVFTVVRTKALPPFN